MTIDRWFSREACERDRRMSLERVFTFCILTGERRGWQASPVEARFGRKAVKNHVDSHTGTDTGPGPGGHRFVYGRLRLQPHSRQRWRNWLDARLWPRPWRPVPGESIGTEAAA